MLMGSAHAQFTASRLPLFISSLRPLRPLRPSASSAVLSPFRPFSGDGATEVADNRGRMSATASPIEQAALQDAVELERPAGPSGWFNRLVAWHLQRRSGRKTVDRVRARDVAVSESDQARSLIRRACLKAAASGAAAGSCSTAAAVLSAQTEGLATVVTVPFAAAAIGLEMGFRTMVHLDLACDLADAFDVPYDLARPGRSLPPLRPHLQDGLARRGERGPGPLARARRDVAGERGGRREARQQGARRERRRATSCPCSASPRRRSRTTSSRAGSATPCAATCATGARCTTRSSTRAPSATSTSISSSRACGSSSPPTASSRPRRWAPSRTCSRSSRPPSARPSRPASSRTSSSGPIRIEKIPERARDEFLHALEVAAAVDKHVGLPERKILRRAAHHLGRPFQRERLEKMIAEFEEYGVLKASKRTKHPE